jgi:hypothetical protein
MSWERPHDQRLALRRTPDDAGLGPDDVTDQLDAARERVRLMDEHERKEGERVARRLFISFGLIMLVMLVGFVVLPLVGLMLPAYVWVLVFVTIAIGTLMAMHGDRAAETDPDNDPLQVNATPGASSPATGPKRQLHAPER